MPFPNPATQFKPGQSGNPPGYSRKRRATDELLALIDEMGADKAIAKRWLKAILDGDFRYFKEYIERVEGKVADKVEQAPSEKPRLIIPDADPRSDAG